MNKKMILPLALVALMVLAMVSVVSADDNEVTTVDTVEVRGEVIRLDNATNDRIEWNATNFAGFWYDLDDDLMTETLWIEKDVIESTPNGADEDRTIDEDTLYYRTSPVFQEYELHENEADPDREYLTPMESEYTTHTASWKC